MASDPIIFNSFLPVIRSIEKSLGGKCPNMQLFDAAYRTLKREMESRIFNEKVSTDEAPEHSTKLRCHTRVNISFCETLVKDRKVGSRVTRNICWTSGEQ